MDGLEMKYFVLNPNKNNAYGRASRVALKVYADDIRNDNMQLCLDIRLWIEQIEKKMFDKAGATPA